MRDVDFVDCMLQTKAREYLRMKDISYEKTFGEIVYEKIHNPLATLFEWKIVASHLFSFHCYYFIETYKIDYLKNV